MKEPTTPETRSTTSAQATHTPGPWATEGAGIRACMVSSVLKSGRRVCFRVAVCKDGELDTVKANARLIAAAPELLNALKDLCEADRDDLNDSTSAVWQAATSAIRKATGQS